MAIGALLGANVLLLVVVVAMGSVLWRGAAPVDRSKPVASPAPTPVADTPGPAPRPTPPTPTVVPQGDLTDLENTTIELFRRYSAGVAFITTMDVRTDPFRRNVMEIPRGTGSGFVWDDQGHVVTNYHVIRGASGARVMLSDNRVFSAELVGYAAHKDLAVLRIEAPPEELTPIPVGTSADLQVGQMVLAIGNPFGLDHTLSTGVISGLGREIRALTGRPIDGVVQTDAAINPGNSGGPLLDSNGRLIGVNTAIYSPSGASAGIGFAVPVDTVARIVPQLIEHGRTIRPAIGVVTAEPEMARRLGVDGALVLKVVPGSPAERAGLEPTVADARTGRIVLGDRIVALDGNEVEGTDDLFRALEDHAVGDQVTLTIDRRGSVMDVRITLEDMGETSP